MNMWIDLMPAPNGIDIHGHAVALDCETQIQKPTVRLGGIVVLIDLPIKDNHTMGHIDTKALLNDLSKYDERSITIEDENITGVCAITMEFDETRSLSLQLSIIKKLAEKHYHAN